MDNDTIHIARDGATDLESAVRHAVTALVALLRASSAATTPDPVVREHDAASLAEAGVTARWMAIRGRRGEPGFHRSVSGGWTAPRSVVIALLANRRRAKRPALRVVETVTHDRELLAGARRVGGGR